MLGQWQKNIVVQAAIWIVAEVVLNIAGLDDLADYSEFIFQRDFAWSNSIATVVNKPRF